MQTIDSDSPDSIARRLVDVKILILDVDGVLTPNAHAVYGPRGNEYVAFSIRDGLGIKLLQRAGIEVALLSGRDVEGVRARARDLGISRFRLGSDRKVGRLRELADEAGVSFRQVAYMGDDVNDVPVMRLVGFSAAPKDAQPEALSAATFVTEARSGTGAVREIAELILKAKGLWQSAVAYYEGE